MSYQRDLMRDRYAQLALQLGWKYRLPASETHELARHLAEYGEKHEQALLQMGVKWVRAHGVG